jgi:hypothetical protein
VRRRAEAARRQTRARARVIFAPARREEVRAVISRADGARAARNREDKREREPARREIERIRLPFARPSHSSFSPPVLLSTAGRAPPAGRASPRRSCSAPPDLLVPAGPAQPRRCCSSPPAPCCPPEGSSPPAPCCTPEGSSPPAAGHQGQSLPLSLVPSPDSLSCSECKYEATVNYATVMP